MAVVISTVSTMSEQEPRNGQGRRDVGNSVHVRQAIGAYAARRLSRAENCKQSGLQ